MFKVLLVYLILWKTSADASERFLVCKSVPNIINGSSVSGTQSSPSGSPGPTGKRGPRGFPGSQVASDLPGQQGQQGQQGPQGPVGMTNCTEINETIYVQLLSINRKLQCMDGVVVGNICYKLPYKVGPGVNFTQASAICTFHGGELAEIPTEETYEAVVKFIRSSQFLIYDSPASSIVDVWLGYTYSGNGKLQLKNGSLSYTRWFPGFPFANSRYTNILLEVPFNPRSNVGMWNNDPSFSGRNTPLCQFVLN